MKNIALIFSCQVAVNLYFLGIESVPFECCLPNLKILKLYPLFI